MKTITKKEAISLLKSPFGSEILKTVSSYVAPLFWSRREYKTLSIQGNGSIFFLRPNDISFAVTANHVYQKYITDKKSYTNIFCQIGDILFPLEERLIDINEELDIATFRITSDEIRKINKIELSMWPPSLPDIGKGVLFAGFPGHERFELSSHEVSFGIYAALGTATTVSERNITCQFKRKDWVEITEFALPPKGYSLNGLSGAPLFTVIERDGLWLWALGGVIYEFSPNIEIIMASRADNILADGSLKK